MKLGGTIRAQSGQAAVEYFILAAAALAAAMWLFGALNGIQSNLETEVNDFAGNINGTQP